jgi:hypothetical protein
VSAGGKLGTVLHRTDVRSRRLVPDTSERAIGEDSIWACSSTWIVGRESQMEMEKEAWEFI